MWVYKEDGVCYAELEDSIEERKEVCELIIQEAKTSGYWALDSTLDIELSSDSPYGDYLKFVFTVDVCDYLTELLDEADISIEGEVELWESFYKDLKVLK